MKCINCGHEITSCKDIWVHVIRSRFGDIEYSNNLFKRGMKDVCRTPEPFTNKR